HQPPGPGPLPRQSDVLEEPPELPVAPGDRRGARDRSGGRDRRRHARHARPRHRVHARALGAGRGGDRVKLSTIEVGLYVFVLATFLGFEVIRRVPSLLHTPLMSLTNASSGFALVGLLVLAGAHETTYATILGTLAVTASTINVVGGFMITDRMLKMFRRRTARP